MKDQAEELSSVLYMVASPIGNLEDLGFRALRLLKEVDWIAAEDTRETRKLLAHYGIDKPLHSLHEHSTVARSAVLALDLGAGKSGAYVSDAGTPGVSDPGAELVRQCVAAGVRVIPVPGASAPLALFSVTGFRSAGFTFTGFFPREQKEREQWAARLRQAGGAWIFFESPHRVQGCLEFLGTAIPQAELVVGRELTKKFETISRGTCASVWESLKSEEPRGEYVLALELEPAGEDEARAEAERETQALLRELVGLGANQKVLVRVAMARGLAKNKAYAMALQALGK